MLGAVVETIVRSAAPLASAMWYLFACSLLAQQPSDTTRPPIPENWSFPDDSTHVVMFPSDTLLVYYRTMVSVHFKPEASGTSIRAFMTKYQLEIVAGIRWLGEYVMRYPDPGESWDAVQASIRAMRSEPVVKSLWLAKRRGYQGGV